MSHQSLIVQNEILYRCFRLRQKYAESKLVTIVAKLQDLDLVVANDSTLLKSLQELRDYVTECIEKEQSIREIHIDIEPSFHETSSICEYILRCGFIEEAKHLLPDCLTTFSELIFPDLLKIMNCLRELLNFSVEPSLEFIQSNSSRFRDLSFTLDLSDLKTSTTICESQVAHFTTEALKVNGFSSISDFELRISCGAVAMKSASCSAHNRKCPTCNMLKVFSSDLQMCRRCVTLLRCTFSDEMIDSPKFIPEAADTPSILVSPSSLAHLLNTNGRYVLSPFSGIAVKRELVRRGFIS